MEIKIDSRAKALIFDLDGTLSDSLPVHIETWHRVCAGLGCTFDESIVPQMTGMATISFAERIKNDHGLTIDPQEIVRRKQVDFWANAHKVRPILPVIEVVKKYHGKIPMAIGTGASRKSAEMQLETLQIKDYFDFIVTADDVDRHKPEPDTFLKCADLLNIAPSDCQVFEDGEMGMQAARTAGMMLIDVRPFVDTEQQ